MACQMKKKLLLLLLVLLVSNLQHCGTQQVPCFFIFGDSSSDNGNNNNLVTKAKANYQPYGIDFPGGPTGRFTNGRNLVDIIAEHLGFNNSIPPFATASGQQILKRGQLCIGCSGYSPGNRTTTVHPTEVGYLFYEGRAYRAMSPDDAYPYDIERLAQS